MKKDYFTAATVMVIGLLGFQAISNSSGASAGHSGSPASNGNTCSSCHSGPAVGSETISITSDIPATGYVPNTENTITVTMDDGGTGVTRAGFQASVEGANSSGHIGAVSAPSSDAKVVGGNYVTHTSSGNSVSGGVRSWDFKWNSGSAPDTGAIYVAVNFSNNNGATSGDVIATEVLGIAEDDGVGVEENRLASVNFYPNPTEGDLFIEGWNGRDEVLIYNLKGELISSKQAVRLPDGGSYLNISDLSAGSYLLFTEGMTEAKSIQKN